MGVVANCQCCLIEDYTVRYVLHLTEKFYRREGPTTFFNFITFFPQAPLLCMAEGMGGLPDNFVSGGISHVATQLDVQGGGNPPRQYKYLAVGVVKRPTHAC